MNKQTKMLLGLAVVAGAGYYIWQKNKAPKTNVVGGGACRAKVGWKNKSMQWGKTLIIGGEKFCDVNGAVYKM
jgi:hypothetical protein